ncbi:hypothetical protein PAXRUDRAFT_830188 [Paxillus rubicundulus Ve08.2h10]|uniref:Histone-lysine N-methyltransferase, H3 lysine-36 specific n=1 Tax=Paxillus rubicundulus Ve08.2h10 TaxID=930991 RepID=A0A0D0DLJ4_9AGAM|nr:hypothetical protein PAXRUDRAFT_830188 [Paxillus rubicundulus Ve08.2h10]
MPKSRSQSQSLSMPAHATQEIKQEQEQTPEDLKPTPEDLEDAQVPPETPSVTTEPSPPPQQRRETSESSTSTPLPANVKPKRPGPQLVGDLPRAEEAARATFIELSGNHYQYGTLGRSREALESMTCDCVYDHGVDDPHDACGPRSDCINRLTQVECLPEDCRCRSHCRNQRFQRKEYADIQLVLTENKGYGLRAGSDIPKDTFIYEYIGDVVSHPSFMKRMREYAEEGIKHFYFMMLQKDEYIDATKRGGIGRFANHSCSPNCYVAKWQVGEHVRMGIFANRSIRKDEELTFNYNVDRYGHDPQPCYCGEPNCVGFLGGKTQTGMDDLMLDALGITEGSKKKKSKKQDDYVPKPLVEKEIPTLIRAARQTSNKQFLRKLLTRIKITENDAALRQIMRLRGFSLMTNILEDYAKDVEVIIVALEAMVKWPLIQRNKVDDSKIRVPVQACAESENATVKSLALKLLEYWDSLEVAYRIPKRLKVNGEEDPPDTPSIIVIESHDDNRPLKKTRWEGDGIKFQLAAPRLRQTTPPPQSQNGDHARRTGDLHRQSQNKKEIADIIAAANAAAEAEAACLAAAAAAAAAAPPATEAVKKKSKPPRKHQTKEEKEANKEKRLMKLVGAVVVKCMSKYSGKMETEMFKKYAKELTHVITEKEKKSSSYKEDRLDGLSDEKVAKIRKFSKEYITKVLRKLEKSKSKHGSHKHSSSHNKDQNRNRGGPQPSGSEHTPDVHRDGEDADGEEDGDVEMVMSVEQAMDLGSDSEDGDHDDEHDVNGDAEMEEAQHSSDEVDHDPSPMEGVSSHVHPAASVSVTPITPPQQQQTVDPRVKHRGWDPDEIKVANGLDEPVVCG